MLHLRRLIARFAAAPALLAWLVVGSHVAHAQLPDPTTVPAKQRIDAINKLFASREGAAADKHYQLAVKRYITLLNPAALGTPDPQEQQAEFDAIGWLSDNETTLLMRFDWPPEYVPYVDRWLRTNADALAALRTATDAPRWYRPFAAESGRLAEIELVRDASELRNLVKLRALAAARLAHDERWADAAREAASNLRLAAHADGRPLVLWEAFATSFEDIAFQQLAALLPHLDAEGLKRVRQSSRDALAVPRPSDDQIDFAERLFTWDTIERYHEWAVDESRHPSLREELTAYFSMYDMIKNSGIDPPGMKIERSSFASADDFKAALRKTTPKASWKVAIELEDAYREWAASPLPEAIPRLAGFRDRSREIGRKDPILQLFGEISPFGPGNFRLKRAMRDARRAGFEVLLALHLFNTEKKAWPARLEELTPALLPRVPADPYSGKPLVYRRSSDGTDFVLYSVGEDQKDDGGQPAQDSADPAATTSGDFVFWPLEVPDFE